MMCRFYQRIKQREELDIKKYYELRLLKKQKPVDEK
jgi:hypothetical protein